MVYHGTKDWDLKTTLSQKSKPTKKIFTFRLPICTTELLFKNIHDASFTLSPTATVKFETIYKSVGFHNTARYSSPKIELSKRRNSLIHPLMPTLAAHEY